MTIRSSVDGGELEDGNGADLSRYRVDMDTRPEVAPAADEVPNGIEAIVPQRPPEGVELWPKAVVRIILRGSNAPKV